MWKRILSMRNKHNEITSYEDEQLEEEEQELFHEGNNESEYVVDPGFIGRL